MQDVGRDMKSDMELSSALMDSLEDLLKRDVQAAASLEKQRGLCAATRAFFYRTRAFHEAFTPAAPVDNADVELEAAASPRDALPDADVWWAAVWTSFLNLPGAPDMRLVPCAPL